MMEKTKLIFKDDVIKGYNHYINFKRDFSGALAVFEKYILPIEGVNIGINANNNWLVIILSYDNEMEDYLEILKQDWNDLTEFLNNEGIQFAYPTRYSDWSMVILIDDFVEWVLKNDW